MAASAKKTDDAIVKRIAARVLRAMAYDRQTFKDKVEEHVGGALLEYYKATLAKKNRQTKWVQHWTTEVRNLLDRALPVVLVHSVRGFKDRRKALNEVFAELQGRDLSYRHIAENVIKRDFRITKLQAHLDDADMKSFWTRVNAVVEVTIQE